MRQIERNGGRTDAEIYALKHAAALEDLYVRAGLALPGNIREEIERVRAHEEGLRAAEGRGE